MKERNKIADEIKKEYNYDLEKSLRPITHYINELIQKDIISKNYALMDKPYSALTRNKLMRDKIINEKITGLIKFYQAKEILSKYKLGELAEKFRHVFA